jgi:hypothetical protein
MWVDEVRMLWLGCCQTIQNQKKNERGTNMAFNQKRRMKNVGDGNSKTVS